VLLARPRFVFLERIDNTLDARDVEGALSALASAGITAIALGNGESSRPDVHGAVLDLGTDGRWSWKVSTPDSGRASSR
jgi:putative ATP-binding cassette transporter